MLDKYLTQRVVGFIQRFPPGIWLMMLMDALTTIAFSIALPFLALYLHNERGISMILVGVIFLVGGISTATTNMIGGILSDRFGRRRLMLVIAGMSVIAYTVLALLIGFNTSLLLIAVVYVLARGIIGTIHPTIAAIVADLSHRGRLAESYALVRVGGNVTFAFGPAIGGYLIGIISYGWLLGIAALSCLLIAVLSYFFLKESFTGIVEKVTFRNTMSVATDRSFLVFTLLGVLLMLSMAHLGTTLSIFTVDRLGFYTSQYGLLLATNGVMVAVLQYPWTYGVNRMSRANGLIMGSLLYVVGYFSLGWVTGFNWAIVSILIISAGEITFTPIASAVVAEFAPPEKRGRYTGFFALSQTMGWSIAPLFGGVLLDVFPSQPVMLWSIIASIGIIAAIGFYLWGKMEKRRPVAL